MSVGETAAAASERTTLGLDGTFHTRLQIARDSSQLSSWSRARRLLLDPSDEVWSATIPAAAQLAQRDPQARRWLATALGQSRWLRRTTALILELARLDPAASITPELPRAGALAVDWIQGRRGADVQERAVGWLPPDHPLSAQAAALATEWLRDGDPDHRVAALAFLRQHGRAEALPAARAAFQALVDWRVYTLPDRIARGEALAASLDWLRACAEASGDRDLTRRLAHELHARYLAAEPKLRRVLLEALYDWSLDRNDLDIPRGFFDAAGARPTSNEPDALLEALRGGILARRYWRETGARHGDDPTAWLQVLGRGDFVAPGRPARSWSDARAQGESALACAERLVRADERAYFLLSGFLRSPEGYRALEPDRRSELLLAMRDYLEIRPPVEPIGVLGALERAVPRLGALQPRLEAIAADVSGALLAETAQRAHEHRLPHLMATALQLMLVSGEHPRAEPLAGLAPLLGRTRELSDEHQELLAAVCEQLLDRAIGRRRDGDAALRAALGLVEAGASPRFLQRVAARARDDRIERLIDALADVVTASEQAELADLTARLASDAEAIRQSLGSKPGPLGVHLTARLELLTRLLASPLLAGLAVDMAAWVRELGVLEQQQLAGSGFEPRAITAGLRDLMDEVETFQTIDLGEVRERRAALTRVEEKIAALLASASTLPALERALLGRAARRWAHEIDRAERFLLKLGTSLFAGSPEQLLGLDADTARAAPPDVQEALERTGTALHRFRVRLLVSRYDLDRAFSLLRHGPDASWQQIEGDRLHARAMVAVTALMFLPFCLYWIDPGAVAMLHVGAVALACTGGGGLLLWIGWRDPWAILPLLMPRLLGALLTWYFVLALGEEPWRFTDHLSPLRFLILIAPTLFACLIYTYAEVTQEGDDPVRCRAKAATAFMVGLTQSFVIGAFLTSILGPEMLANVPDKGSHPIFGVPDYIVVFGLPLFPTTVLAWSLLVLFLAMFLNLLFEDER